MSVIVLLELQVKPEAVNEVKATFKQILPDTRAYAGCLGVEVNSNQDDSGNIVLVERWESREHYQKYLAWRTETGALTALSASLTAPPKIRYYDHVGA